MVSLQARGYTEFAPIVCATISRRSDAYSTAWSCPAALPSYLLHDLYMAQLYYVDVQCLGGGEDCSRLLCPVLAWPTRRPASENARWVSGTLGHLLCLD